MALRSNGQLLVRHPAPSLSATSSLRPPLPFSNYRLEPLFHSTSHLSAVGALGALPAQGPTWSLAKPTAVAQMNPWDAAHQAAEQQNYAAYVEPDILHATADPPAGVVAASGLNEHYPPKDMPNLSPGWHLGQDYCGFENIRQLASGTGVRIAHLDTGYTPGHSSTPRGMQPQLGWNFWDDNDDTLDPGTTGEGLFQPGHGTATLALLAGAHVDLVFGAGDYHGDFGGAPDASVVPVRIGPTVIHFYTSTMARGLNYALAPRGDATSRCDVISLSHGGLPSASWATAVNALYEAGVVVVAASGDNFYFAIADVATQYTVYPSAFNRVVTALGATYESNPYVTTDVGVMQGSWGPDAVMKKAIAAYTPNVAWMEFGNLPSGFDMSGGGTSASTPQIAAACALWLQVHGNKFPKDWRVVEACRLALFGSATNKNDVPQSKLGWGALNVPGMLADGLADSIAAKVQSGVVGKSAEDSVSFPFWRELFGEPPPGSAQEEMYETEVAQVVLSSANPVLVKAAQAVGQGQHFGPGEKAAMVAALKSETISAALLKRLS